MTLIGALFGVYAFAYWWCHKPTQEELPPCFSVTMSPGTYSRKTAYHIDPLLARCVAVVQPFTPRAGHEIHSLRSNNETIVVVGIDPAHPDSSVLAYVSRGTSKIVKHQRIEPLASESGDNERNPADTA